jgi:NAD(P)-dependent dehydrogenase (short-subunit alcohol dehydrogenase family)
MTLTGKFALVTGAGSGIGKACAFALAEAGAAVVTANINAAAAATTAEAITQGQKRAVRSRWMLATSTRSMPWCGRRSYRLVKSTS